MPQEGRVVHDTGGYRGWWPMKTFDGKGPDGQMQGREVFKNVVNGQVAAPEKGWNGEPPAPTGDLSTVRHSSDAYRSGWERIWGSREAT